jgi:hypothetical protein
MDAMTTMVWRYFRYSDLRGRFVALLRRSALGHTERWDANVRRWVTIPGESLSSALEHGDPLLDEISPQHGHALMNGGDGD